MPAILRLRLNIQGKKKFVWAVEIPEFPAGIFVYGNVGSPKYKIQALDAKDFNNPSMILKWKNTKQGEVFPG